MTFIKEERTIKIMTNNIAGYLINPKLPLIKDNWKGNPVDDEKRFIHPEYPFLPNLRDVYKMMTENNPQKKEKKSESFKLKTEFPKMFFESGQDGFFWIGHATFLIRLAGITFVTDPVFESPSFIMKRHSALPCDPGLLKHIDYLLLSHDHRDHLDKNSLQLLQTNNPQMQTLTGLGMYALLHSLKMKDIQEAGWYQSYYIKNDSVKVVFLPARHWAKRGLFDNNKRLWGSFIIQSKETTIYFGADSGYGNHYKEIAALFPHIDYAILGIGAYKPSWFMSPIHTSPAEALIAADDLKAKYLVPMHFGAFDLSDEPMGEPPRLLDETYKNGQFASKLLLLQLGELHKF